MYRVKVRFTFSSKKAADVEKGHYLEVERSVSTNALALLCGHC